MTTRGEKYQPHIDGLRAIAVIAVLLFHLEVPGFSGGFVGVDVFLVISGFLITRLLRDEFEATGKVDFKRFYTRRIRRLAPALIAVLLATATATALLASTSMLKSFGGELVAALLCYSNINFWIEADYFDVSARVKPLLHTWSLSVEEQFYFFWPLLLFLTLRSRWRRWTLWLVVALGAASLLLNFPFSKGIELEKVEWLKPLANGKSTIFFLLPFRVYEFAIGAALVWVADRWEPPRWLCDLLCVVGLGLIGWAVGTFNEEMLFPASAALIPCAGAAVLIVGGDRARTGALLRNRVAVGIGLISYSLYLIHWPAIVYWEYCTGTLTNQSKIIIAGSSLALACLTYWCIEQPFRTRRWPIWPAAPAYATVALLGVAMWMSSGWLWRLNPRPPFDLGDDATAFHIKYFGGAGRGDFNRRDHGGPVDVVLLGDSMAQSLTHGLDLHVRRGNAVIVRAVTDGSFIHLPGFTRTTAGTDWDNLVEREMAAAVRLVKAQPVPPVLLVSQSWLSQMNRGALLPPLGDASTVTRPDVADIAEGIERLKAVTGASRVVVVGQFPGSQVNCAEQMCRPALSRSADSEAIRTSSPQDKVIQFNQEMREIAGTDRSFVFFDPTDDLCDQGLCANLDPDGYPLYSDTGHPSLWGSSVIVRALSSVLAPEVERLQRDRASMLPRRVVIRGDTVSRVSGSAFKAKADCDIDGDGDVIASPVQLHEDGVPIGPAHADDRQIRRGRGAFRYLGGGEVLFSSSDGSDARTNGRIYELVYWQPKERTARGF
jgi:peptidoglycan/LPS O-acetylase OafA/YrhL